MINYKEDELLNHRPTTLPASLTLLSAFRSFNVFLCHTHYLEFKQLTLLDLWPQIIAPEFYLPSLHLCLFSNKRTTLLFINLKNRNRKEYVK